MIEMIYYKTNNKTYSYCWHRDIYFLTLIKYIHGRYYFPLDLVPKSWPESQDFRDEVLLLRISMSKNWNFQQNLGFLTSCSCSHPTSYAHILVHLWTHIHVFTNISHTWNTKTIKKAFSFRSLSIYYMHCISVVTYRLCPATFTVFLSDRVKIFRFSFLNAFITFYTVVNLNIFLKACNPE